MNTRRLRSRARISAREAARRACQSKAALTVREFCALYGICRDTFYREVRCRRLRAVKLGTKTLVLNPDADAWAASLPALKLPA
jgi:excisionase family DNA binding protein